METLHFRSLKFYFNSFSFFFFFRTLRVFLLIVPCNSFRCYRYGSAHSSRHEKWSTRFDSQRAAVHSTNLKISKAIASRTINYFEEYFSRGSLYSSLRSPLETSTRFPPKMSRSRLEKQNERNKTWFTDVGKRDQRDQYGCSLCKCLSLITRRLIVNLEENHPALFSSD